MLPIDRVLVKDALRGLQELPDESVDCVLTSPPYWGVRDYGIPGTEWSDGSVVPLGLEEQLPEYVSHLMEIIRELQRVLKPSGTLWLNLADNYGGPWGEHAKPAMRQLGRRGVRPGVLKKSLSLVPEHVAIAMAEDGWILRNRIAWHKPNSTPSGVKDRFACSWEHVYLYVKQAQYYFDIDAVRVPYRSRGPSVLNPLPSTRFRARAQGKLHTLGARNVRGVRHPLGKIPHDCWEIPARKAVGRHPAGFPERVCEIPIKAGCPRGGLVLDPFIGSGTTAVVARRLGRHFIGLEASPEFAKVARKRIALATASRKAAGERAA